MIPIYPAVPKSALNQRIITLIPFLECNIDCGFCYYRDKPRKNLSIKEILHAQIENAKRIIPQLTTKEITLEMHGGELFSDNIKDSDFNLYLPYLKEIQSIIKQAGKTHTVSITSNMTFKSYDRFAQFLKSIDTLESVYASFDIVERFKNKTHFNLYKRNIDKLIADGINVCLPMVASSKCHDAILSKAGFYNEFVSMYNSGYKIYLEDYHADVFDAEYSLTQKELTDFLLYIKEHFPNITLPLRNETNHVNLECSSAIELVYDTVEYSCCINQEESALRAKRLNCLSCEYVQSCKIPCFHSLPDAVETCEFKALHASFDL